MYIYDKETLPKSSLREMWDIHHLLFLYPHTPNKMEYSENWLNPFFISCTYMRYQDCTALKVSQNQPQPFNDRHKSMSQSHYK